MNATVSVVAPATVEVCQSFTVDVVVSTHDPPPLIGDYDFSLIYDPLLMTPLDAWDGGLLMPTVAFSWEIVPNYPSAGTNAVHCWAKTDDGGAAGPGTLATIQFHCDGPGGSALNLEIKLSDTDGNLYLPTEVNNGFVSQEYGIAHTYIDPPIYEVPPCVTFPVYVMIENVTNLHEFLFAIYYNSSCVDCIDVIDGGFLMAPTDVVQKTIDPVLGRINFWLNSTSGVGVSGSGPLAKIMFHCSGLGIGNLTINPMLLVDPDGTVMPTTTADGLIIQTEYLEPKDLREIVDWYFPYACAHYALVDIPFVPPSSPEGYAEVKATLTDKGFFFDPMVGGSAMEVTLSMDDEELHGNVTSWWSNDTLEDGTRACLLSAEMDDGTDMAMGFVTNLLPPEQIPEVDPYIIVNAQPYIFVDFYWWAWSPVGKVVRWPYWWYDSHSHPNWFWGIYWWWRTYTRSYYYPYNVVPYWRPWWGWWWHWTYRQHWYWWSTYFPYIDP